MKKITVKTINGLHFLYCGDRFLREVGGFWSYQKPLAEAVAKRMNDNIRPVQVVSGRLLQAA